MKSLVCNGTAFNGSTATINLVLRESVTCIFTNQMRGNIEIITDSIPDDRQDFEYPVSGGSLTGSFTLDDDTGAAGEGIDYLDIQQFDDIPAGSYTVSEIVPRGWDLTNLTCSDPDGETTTSVDGEAIIDLDPGETVTCTFENTKSGTITIEKITEGGDGTFTFTGDAIGTQTITTEGEPGQATVTDLPANQSYTATEAVHPSFDLTNITCLDGDDSGTPSSEDPDSRTATFALDPGETVKCTFTNIKRGTIVIEKQTIGGDDSFAFTGDLGAKSIVTNNNVGELRLENVVANQSYIVNESDPTPMFDLTDIVCEDGDPSGVASRVDIGGRAAHFQVDPGETVKCTFINTKRGTIIVEKRTIGGDGNFTFTGDVAGTISPGQPIVVANVVPNATYTSTEADPSPDFVLTDLTCDDAGSTLPSSWDINTRTATFEVDPGETVTCTFTNTKRGTLTIVQDSLPIDPQNFEFYFLGGGRSSTFFLDDDSTLRGGGKNELPDTEIFSGLAPGTPFSISQATVMVPDPRDPTVQVPAWDLTDITCVGGTGFFPGSLRYRHICI